MRGLGSVLVALFLTAIGSTAIAQDLNDQEVFKKGVASLKEGSFEQAITLFEELADRGLTSPDASYNRGLAYLGRVRAHAERPGDLGRAAAGFEECSLLRSGDDDAEQALDLVRAEVAHRSVQRGGEAKVQAKPSLGQALVMLTSEKVWAILAVFASATLSVGLVLRRKKRGIAHLSGLIASWVGALTLLAFGPAVYFSRHFRLTTQAAVVVAPDARIVDENGASQQVDPIPEASRVDVIGRKGMLVKIRYGTLEGWTHGGSVRVLMER